MGSLATASFAPTTDIGEEDWLQEVVSGDIRVEGRLWKPVFKLPWDFDDRKASDALDTFNKSLELLFLGEALLRCRVCRPKRSW